MLLEHVSAWMQGGWWAVPVVVVIAVVAVRRRSSADLTKAIAAVSAEVERAEARADVTYASAGVAWWEFDVATGVFAAGEALWKVVDLPPRLAPTTIDDALAFVHPDDREAARQALADLDQWCGHMELRWQSPGRPLRWVAVSAMPAPSPSAHIVGVARDITEDKFAATVDALRSHADPPSEVSIDLLHQRCDEWLRDGVMSSVLVVELRGLDDAGVVLGNEMATLLSEAVAERLTQTRPPRSLLARWTDRHLVVVLPGDVLEAELTALGFLDLLDRPIEVDGASVMARASVGMAVGPLDGGSFDQLVARARGALRRACDAPSIERFTRNDTIAARRALAVERHVVRSIETDALDVVFQPIVESTRGVVVAVEALVRAPGTSLGAIASDEIVACADRCGLGLQLFSSVLRQSLVAASQWRAEGLVDLVSINVSPLVIGDSRLPDTLVEALSTSDTPRHALLLEVTEQFAAEGFDEAVGRVRALGVQVAIDDFGVGASSLDRLGRLTVDMVKLDRSFVAGAPLDTRRSAIVALAAGAAHACGATFVVEGVEQRSTVESLAALDVDAVQGFGVLPAARFDAVTEFLRAAAVHTHEPDIGE